MVDWKKVRADFPVTKDHVYFISAGLSPIPNPVLDSINAEYTKLNCEGDIHWKQDIAAYHSLMGFIGKHINADADDLAIVSNTSTAMSLVALALVQKEGDGFNVISMMDEFPSTTVPFEYQGISMKYVEPSESRYSVASILEQIDERTLAVVTSYVQYATGFRQDLKRLGQELKKRNLLFIVNATQAFPLFPIDVKEMGIDALAASLHKWGFIGHAGSVFFTSPEFRNRYRTPIAGWLSIIPEDGGFIHTAKNKPLRLHWSADQYVFGSINFQAINPFAQALKYLEGIGFENIRQRLLELNDRLIAGLKSLNIRIISPMVSAEERSAIVSFDMGNRTAECLPYLKKKRIHVSHRGGAIRAAMNIFNDEGDIDALLSALKEFQGI